ncbi:hypothetical protein [Photobacterium halotolerans]|uniref:Uncharacterized protein n=1 Tax=Photobacterium halotolerans TaxID=265726 RepID=A0A7X5AUN4_9GAMM|nr:hypothetical protein [Photobacterium halotolerans]NAW66140.1 hypothetical protein [Photobacterium halotolerans]
MIPGIGGGLTNSGQMPIDAGGGAAGPSSSSSSNTLGGIRQGSINMGGTPVPTWVWVLLGLGAAWWVLKK